jgi:signal transduction histidine kinase
MRRRILLLVVGMTTLVVLAFAVPLAVLIRHTTYQDAVQALQRQANQVALYLNQQPSTATLGRYLSDEVAAKYRVSVQLPSGQVVGRSIPGNGDHAPEPDDRSAGHPGPPQARSQAWAGGQLTVQRAGPEQSAAVVRVWESDDDLHSGEDGWFAVLAGVAVALLLIGGAAGELLSRRIVRPLVDTARTAQQLSAGDTAARAPTAGPGEVADVGRALNRLADRIDELIAEERETVADLSHRLRTPLTALRLDAEALRDPAEAERMGAHATTLERTLTAVIRAARRPQREGRLPACDATAVVAGRVGFWSALTDEQERAATIELPAGPVPVRAAADDLAAAVDALLENVVAHTPEGTAFAVRLAAADGGGGRLEVADEGPGLAPDPPVRGRSDRGSTGLGLDIARRCAEASGGTMTISAGPSGGAVVVLELGAP